MASPRTGKLPRSTDRGLADLTEPLPVSLRSTTSPGGGGKTRN